MNFRTAPMFSIKEEVKIDRENSIIRGVSTFQSGVEALGHGIMGDAVTVQQLITLGNSRTGGIKSRLGHPGLSEDGTAKQLGRFYNFRADRTGERALADLHFLQSARKSPAFQNDVVEYILSMAEEAPEDFGTSIVFAGEGFEIGDDGEEYSVDNLPEDVEPTTEFPVVRIEELRAVDFVDSPAANRSGLFMELNQGYDAGKAEHYFNELDRYIADMGIDADKAYQFMQRYFATRLEGKRKNIVTVSLPYFDQLQRYKNLSII